MKNYFNLAVVLVLANVFMISCTKTGAAEEENPGMIDENDDVLTSTMMSETPGSCHSIDQISSVSVSIKNSRHIPSILSFGRSPGFRTIS